MKSWVDYYNKRAGIHEDPLVISEMTMGSSSETQKQLQVDRKHLLGYLKPQKGSSLLDLGCCAGNSIGLVKGEFSSVTGVDLAEDALTVARKNHPDVEIIHDDISRLVKLEGKSFTHVLAFGVLHYLDPDEIVSLFSSISHLLARSGRLVFVRVPSKDMYEEYQSYRKSRNPDRPVEQPAAQSWNFIDAQWMEEVARGVGLSLDRLDYPHQEFPLRAFFDCVFVKKEDFA